MRRCLPRRPLLLFAAAVATSSVLALAATGPALARVGFSFGLGTTFFPTPWYYAPPPPPPAYGYVPYGTIPPIAPSGPSCRAGSWSCPLGAPARIGDACSCPTPQGPAWGRVGG